MKINALARLKQGNEAQLSGEVAHPQSAHASLGSDDWTIITAYFPECSDGPQSVSVTLHWRGKAITLLSMDPEKGPSHGRLSWSSEPSNDAWCSCGARRRVVTPENEALIVRETGRSLYPGECATCEKPIRGLEGGRSGT